MALRPPQQEAGKTDRRAPYGQDISGAADPQIKCKRLSRLWRNAALTQQPINRAGSRPTCTKKAPPLPCVTVPLNLLETEGTRWIAFDFQSRPVGHNRN